MSQKRSILGRKLISEYSDHTLLEILRLSIYVTGFQEPLSSISFHSELKPVE